MGFDSADTGAAAASARSAETRRPEQAQPLEAVQHDISGRRLAADDRQRHRHHGRCRERLQMLQAMIAVCGSMLHGRLHTRIGLKRCDMQRSDVPAGRRTMNERERQCAGDDERQHRASHLRGRGPVQSSAHPAVITLHRCTLAIPAPSDQRWTWQGGRPADAARAPRSNWLAPSPCSSSAVRRMNCR
jgi:hypothetical protein